MDEGTKQELLSRISQTIETLDLNVENFCFVYIGRVTVVKTRLVLFYRSAIEIILSLCITCWGGTISKRESMKVDRIIKILEKTTRENQKPCPSDSR